MRPPDGPTSMRQTLNSPPPAKCWEQTQWSLNSIIRTDCCAILAISVFHQASVQSRFGKLTTIGWQDTLASKRQWQCCRNISIGRNFDMRSASISGPALPMLLPNQPLRNRACTPLFLLLTNPRNPSQWTTYQPSHPPRWAMTVFLWLLITFHRWRSWSPARRTSL